MAHTLKMPVLFLLLICSAIGFTTCKKTNPPTVTTTIVSDVTQTTATSGGNVTADGGAEVMARGVCWNTSENPVISNSKTTNGSGTGSFTSSLTNLIPNTKYYVRAYATNSEGTSYGNQVTFNASQVAVPDLTTAEITAITQTTAVSGGNIISDNGSPVTASGVCWATTAEPTIEDNITTDDSGSEIFTSNLTGLLAGATYYIRSYATNGAGTGYGNQITFTTLPTLTTAVISFTTTTANIGGSIVSEGEIAVTASGVCWSTTQNPVATGSHTTDGAASGSFVSSMTSLEVNTTYYVRAYATTGSGTAYGNEISFTTMLDGTATDNDGNIYSLVTIGTQIWMAENLKTTTFNDGSAIPLITDSIEWTNATTSGYCWYNNDENTFKPEYGALYNWYAGNTGKLCPTGWHVPTNSEFIVLRDYLGGESIAGGKLKEVGNLHWLMSNSRATNETGFTAIPGGSRFKLNGNFVEFSDLGLACYFQTFPEFSPSEYWYIGLYWYDGNFYIDHSSPKTDGLSVRCIMN